MTKIKPYLPYLIALALLIVIGYWGITGVFYQQDEWQQIGLIRSGVISFNPFHDFSLTKLLVGQGRFFSDLILGSFLQLFPFNNAPLAVASLLLHILNAYLVFALVEKLVKNRLTAFLAALFFAVNAVSNQAVIWGAAIATLPATSLILLSIFSYLNFLETDRKSWLYYSLGALFLSLFFKEIGIFLIIFLPVLWFIKRDKATWSGLFKTNWLLLAYGALIIAVRISQILFGGTKNGTIISGEAGALAKILVHLVLYPLTGIFQTLAPSKPIYDFARWQIAHIQYSYLHVTPLAEIVPQTIITDMLTMFGTGLLILLVVLAFRREANPEQKNRSSLALIGFLLAALSFLPYAILDRGGSYMDSRYYYVAAIGTGMILAALLSWLFERKLLGKILATILAAAFFSVHFYYLQYEIKGQRTVAAARQHILHSIKELQPELKSRTVVYVTGNQDYYIGGNKIPFQQGFGNTLLVWYKDDSQFTKELLADKYLWDQGSQGFTEQGERAFGFFNLLPDLKKAVADHQFEPELIQAYYWDDPKQELTDISESIREAAVSPN